MKQHISILAFFIFVPVHSAQFEEQDINLEQVIQPSMIEELQTSYSSDHEKFIQDQKLEFVKQQRFFTTLKLLNEIFFPKYWNQSDILTSATLLRAKLFALAVQISKGIAPYIQLNSPVNQTFPINKNIQLLMKKIPTIRERLKKDVQAAYEGDPAAQDYTEIIRCYPGFLCLVVQRVAHELYSLKIPTYPRELMEQVHRMTSIDIHPGAQIGDYFFIDHGDGTVVGETCIIGNRCRLYQGVTLGALHFEQDEQTHMLKKGYKRHPTLGDNVVVGAGAKILGNIHIGDHVSIGANCWVQTDIAPRRTVYIKEHPQQTEKERH